MATLPIRIKLTFLAAEPTKSSSSDKIWRRPPTRTVALDLSNFDIFDDDVPILGDVQISGKFISVFLGCIGIVVVIDLRRDRDINVKVCFFKLTIK